MPYKTFRPWLPMQPTLLPTDIARWLPDKHLARFVVEIVDQLDMSPIQLKYHVKDPRGVQPYDPRMMVALLLYAYAVGVFSSRRIERATYEDVAFRVLTGNQQPDHDTIATFRREHLTEIRALFVEVLRIAGRMGLVAFGSLGLDGVKVRANASKHQAMSYGRMKAEEARLQAEIDELLRHAEQTDTDEALRFGNGELVDIPEELALRRRGRRGSRRPSPRWRRRGSFAPPSCGSSRSGTRRPQRTPSASRQAHARWRAGGEGAAHNTDPESRIMVRDGDHYVQAFNAQAVVTEEQIIVATGVGNQAPDAE